MQRFNKSFTQQEPISNEAIAAANAVMLSGRLHRYNTIDDEPSEVDSLEQEFSSYMGSKYCLACASGGYALQVALRAAGVTAGDKVLSNAFTLAPVPGAIDACGAIPVLVDVANDYCVDLDHLEQQAEQSSARFFMLSHMRGRIADMDRVMDICQRFSLVLIEDCAHTMGASWDGRKSGLFGDVACYSTQTYKHINSGEGGLLISQNDDLMARAIMYSGSYMFFSKHSSGPPASSYADVRLQTPNYSARMDNLRAAILRPQLRNLDHQCERWNQRYRVLERGLRQSNHIFIPNRPDKEQFVASSIQFSLPDFNFDQIASVLRTCEDRGIALKWFGDANPVGYTSRFDSWEYLAGVPALEATQSVLATLMDMRIPLTFELDDCELIAEIIVAVVDQTAGQLAVT